MKSFFFIFFLLVYGAICTPITWLDKFTKGTFDALAVLYVLYCVVSFIVVALLHIYIPHVMHLETDMLDSDQLSSNSHSVSESHAKQHRQEVGTRMSFFGFIFNSVAVILVLVLGIILSSTLRSGKRQAASVKPARRKLKLR